MATTSDPERHFFQFEADFVRDLRCIPMQVRMKLDSCGVKLKLVHWHQFTLDEREQAITLPCQTPEECQVYRQMLRDLVRAKSGEFPKDLPVDPHPLWLDETSIPDMVQEKAASMQVSLTLDQWVNLSPPQRFALLKLSRPSHENHNFLPALREFHLLP